MSSQLCSLAESAAGRRSDGKLPNANAIVIRLVEIYYKMYVARRLPTGAVRRGTVDYR